MASVLLIGFVGMMLAGVPIIMAMFAGSLMALAYAGMAGSLYVVPQQILDGIENPSLIAIPFFILAGNLMNAAEISDRIFNFANALVGSFRGGLAQVCVVSSAIFAGVSGSALADIAGLGTVQVKAMRARGYPVPYAAALIVAAALIAPTVPPSIALIVYAYLANESVARMFLAGLLPGTILALSLMASNLLIATVRGFPREPSMSLGRIAETAVDGIAALLAPGIILAAIVGGFTTPTEAGVIACAYSVFLGLVYRSLTWEKALAAVSSTVLVCAMIMMIIGFSTLMGWLLAIEQVPQQLAQLILGLTHDRSLFLFLLVVFLLAIGCLVESVPAKVILVPILLPVIDQFGVDRVQFGLILTLSLAIGIAHPPIGIGLFIMMDIAKLSLERLTLAILPLFVPLLIVLFLIAYVPSLTLWLPTLLMGPR
jgi:tripartite ATP-independent transporter DctM subunit